MIQNYVASWGQGQRAGKIHHDLDQLAIELTHGQLSVFMGSAGEICSEAQKKKAGLDQLIQKPSPSPHLEREPQLRMPEHIGLRREVWIHESRTGVFSSQSL